MRIYVILFLLFTIFWSCKKKTSVVKQPSELLTATSIQSPVDSQAVNLPTQRSYQHLIEVIPSKSIVIDMPYASKDNFTNTIIYACPACFVSDTLYQKLVEVADHFYYNYGYSIKLFDCYRPLPAQQKLWDKAPNATYVTDPSKGSMHNRGMAIDLTLVDSIGNDLDMGTGFDHFGRAAHIDNYNHSPEVLRNRALLTEVMAIHGFKGIRTEWWHYSMRSPFYPILRWQWECL